MNINTDSRAVITQPSDYLINRATILINHKNQKLVNTNWIQSIFSVMGKSRFLLTYMSLCCLLWALSAEAKRLPIQVRYQDAASRVNKLDYLQIGQVRDAISKNKFVIPRGINDRILIDWALNLRNLIGGQDIFNVSKECGRQLGEFSANLYSVLSNLTSPLELFDEKNWSLKGRQRKVSPKTIWFIFNKTYFGFIQ